MTNKDLANVIFPDITKTIEDYEKEYPKRDLPLGACVTRFAPSPTGFMHIGHFMPALIDYVVAKQSGGVFYLRNEDTDKARENKLALTDTEKAEIESNIDQIEKAAHEKDYSINRWLRAQYGKGVTEKIVRQVLEDNYLSTKYFEFL